MILGKDNTLQLLHFDNIIKNNNLHWCGKFIKFMKENGKIYIYRNAGWNLDDNLSRWEMSLYTTYQKMVKN